jgi:release factor glutamine methyltransferase
MLIRELLINAKSLLEAAGAETAYLDAVLLLAEADGTDKTRLLARLAESPGEESEKRFQVMLHQRLQGIPVSYILRRKEFFGLTFFVDERVLVPRPDTECLVEAALALIRARPQLRRIHDACTGSGCVAIALAHSTDCEVSASDLSDRALEVFRLNCERILGRVLPHEPSDLLGSVAGPFDLITANPPYLRSAEVQAMQSGRWPEPALALDGGEDGLSLAGRLVDQAVGALSPGGCLLLEADDAQAGTVASLLRERGYHDIEQRLDLAGRRRVSLGYR